MQGPRSPPQPQAFLLHGVESSSRQMLAGFDEFAGVVQSTESLCQIIWCFSLWPTVDCGLVFGIPTTLNNVHQGFMMGLQPCHIGLEEHDILPLGPQRVFSLQATHESRRQHQGSRVHIVCPCLLPAKARNGHGQDCRQMGH